MNEKLKALAKQYSLHSFQVICVERFSNTSKNNHEEYKTIRGAFIFPIEGEACICFDSERFQAGRGDLVHGCPGKRVRFEVPEGEVFEYIKIYYFQTEKDMAFACKIKSEEIIPLLQQIVEVDLQTGKKADYQREILLTCIFDRIFYEDDYRFINDGKDLVKEVMVYLKEHYNQRLSLEEIAAYAGKKPTQLSYLFHKYVGMRPIDYLIDCRIKKAVQLLGEENYSVKETAEAVGYADPLYFSRLFKQKTGFSPKQIKMM